MYPHHIHSFVVIYKNNTYEVCSKMASNKLLTKKIILQCIIAYKIVNIELFLRMTFCKDFFTLRTLY